MSIHPAQLAEIRQIVAQARAVDPEDDQLAADMLEAETDFDAIVGNLLQEREQHIAKAAALAHVGDKYHAAAKAETERARRKRDLLGRLADIVGGKIKHTLGSVYWTTRKPAPEVDDDVDVDDLPEEFVRIKREPDKNAMKAAFAAGRNVPGVKWGEAKRTVTIK